MGDAVTSADIPDEDEEGDEDDDWAMAAAAPLPLRGWQVGLLPKTKPLLLPLLQLSSSPPLPFSWRSWNRFLA